MNNSPSAIRLSYIVIPRVEQFPSPSDFKRLLAVLKDTGYEGVELNMTGWLLTNLDSLQSWLREYQLSTPSFLTGEAYFEGLCLTSPDPGIRQRAVERLIQCVRAAKRLNSLFVVGMLQGTAQNEPVREVAQQRIVDGLSLVAATAEKEGVQFVIEPVNHLQVGFNNSVAEVRALIKAVGHGCVKPMVDTIHMNIEERSSIQPILDCGGELAHVHVCESNGSEFGTGHVDFAGVLDALDSIGYRGFASVKVYRHLSFEEAAVSSFQYLQKVRSSLTVN